MGRRIVVPSPAGTDRPGPPETAFDRSVRERMAIEAETRALGERRRAAALAKAEKRCSQCYLLTNGKPHDCMNPS